MIEVNTKLDSFKLKLKNALKKEEIKSLRKQIIEYPSYLKKDTLKIPNKYLMKQKVNKAKNETINQVL